MHQQPGFRCGWFENETRVASYDQVEPRAGDVFMVPEILAWQFVTLWPGLPKVIFSQNGYQTFSWKTEEHRANPYTHPDFKAVIVVSEDSRAYLEYTFGKLNVHRVRYSVDPKLFYFEPGTKKRQIAYMPRKRERDAVQVVSLLKYRGKLDGWEVVRIDEKSEAQTAAILRESAIFLSLSAQEGWGLPPMEAIACGCVTIGYDGGGGREFLKEPYATPVESQDVIGFAREVEKAIGEIESNAEAVWGRTREGSRLIQEEYSPGVEAGDVVGVWRDEGGFAIADLQLPIAE